MVVEQRTRTPEEVLREHHVYSFNGRVDEASCNRAMQWLLSENLENPRDPLTMLVSSYGGELDPAFGLIDLMLSSPNKIRTVGVGYIMSAGFLIHLAGAERIITKNASIMCHQLSSGFYGKYHDIIADQDDIKNTHKRMVEYVSQRIGMKSKKVESELLKPTDRWITPKEAVKMGIAHKIVSKLPK